MTKAQRKSGMGEVWFVALDLFRKVNGSGDGGSESEFYALNPAIQAGWLKCARYVMRLKAKRERALRG